MADPPQFVDFTLTDRATLLTVMRSLQADQDGWINLAPSLAPEQVPDPPSAITRIFGPRGPDIPFGTWVPGVGPAGRVPPTSIGLQHGAGAKAIWQLRDHGILVPDTWKVLADHGRRGIVIEVPAAVGPEPALEWLVRAAVALTAIPLPDDWRAAVHRR